MPYPNGLPFWKTLLFVRQTASLVQDMLPLMVKFDITNWREPRTNSVSAVPPDASVMEAPEGAACNVMLSRNTILTFSWHSPRTVMTFVPNAGCAAMSAIAAFMDLNAQPPLL